MRHSKSPPLPDVERSDAWWEQGDGQQDCLLLSHLPSAEDMRYARFPGFADKQELVPQQQLESMRSLISSLHHALMVKLGFSRACTLTMFT
jgi:hypothetical protein